MADALVQLATITLTSAQSSVVFSNIPTNGFKDLHLVCKLGVSSANGGGFIFNNDTTSGNYSWVQMLGSGSSTLSNSGALANNSMAISPNYNLPTSLSLNFTMDIMDYSATDRHKTMIWRADDAAQNTLAIVGRWASTNAITKIDLSANVTTWLAGSTFSLYGVVA
jgi:hypothetical protein